MLGRIVIIATLAFLANAAVVIDRVAVVVGRRAVKISDIERDLRVSQFLNRQPLDLSENAKRKASERLIDQELIRQEILNGGYAPASDKEVNAFVQQMRSDRSQLSRYGLTEDQFRQALFWQLTVLRFIDQRFRPGVVVTDDEVRAYYDEHRAAFQNRDQEAVDGKIREIIAGERVNRNFEDWLDQARTRTRVEYRQEAFK